MNKNIWGDFQICIGVPLKFFYVLQNKECVYLTKLLPTMTSIWLNYVNVPDYSENVKNMFLYEKILRYLKNDYQFFDTFKAEDCKIRGNCNLLIKVKFHKLEGSSPLILRILELFAREACKFLKR